VVVGHSLGSVIGYDILTFAWSLFNEEGDKTKPHPELNEIEESIKEGVLDCCVYQTKQKKLWRELSQNGNPWLVTDFITLGSPLAHADILIGEDLQDLKSKQSQRELPTCPPVLESGKFSFPTKDDQRVLHHAAVFGPTRWTNLYFPARGLIFGDLIGGPLQGLFSWGICDREVKTSLRGGLLSHSFYWKQKKGQETASHIAILRASLNLLDN